MKLGELAAQLGATLHGDPEAEITGVAGIEEAGAGEVTFVSNPRYASAAKSTRASAVLVSPTFRKSLPHTLRLPNPYLAFAQAIELFYPRTGLSPRHTPHRRHRLPLRTSVPTPTSAPML